MTERIHEAVSAQLDAFNGGDLEAFVAAYADDCVVVGVAPEPIVGAAALRAFYAPRLAAGALRCEVHAAVRWGERFTVVHEAVLSETTATETVATFEVVDGRITRASMIKAPAVAR